MSNIKTRNKIPSSIQDVWAETRNRLKALLNYESPVVFKAAPGTGKTTALFQVANLRNLQITYLAARHDMYEQAKEKAIKAGFAKSDIAVVPVPHEDCPTFRGDHGDDNAQEWQRLYRLGLDAWYLHMQFDAPCQPDCPYMKSRIENPDRYEVIIGHYTHARSKSKIEDRVVFLDEFARSAFLTSFGNHDAADMTISETVNGYFAKQDLLPWKNYGDFIANMDIVSSKGYLAFEMEKDDLKVESKDILESAGPHKHHKLAPLIVYSILLAEDLGNGWEYWEQSEDPMLAYPHNWSQACRGPEDIVVVRNGGQSASEDEIHVLDRPDLSAADQIIGLDGTARKPLWDLIFEQNFAIEEYLTGDRMLDYVTDIQDMTLVSAGDGVKPYSSGNYVYSEANATVALWTRIMHDKPILITPKKAGKVLKKEVPRMFANDLRSVEAGDNEFMTHGMVKSNNEAAGEGSIYVCGSTHSGDGVLKKWAALMGVGLTRRSGTRGTGLVYEPRGVGDVLHQHFVHDRMAQAILRGRKADPNDDGSVVVVNSKAVPDWFKPDYKVNVKKDSPFRSENRRQFVRYLRAQGEAETTDLENEFDVHSTTIQRAMDDLESIGWIEKKDRPGPKPTLYKWNRE